jgi:outer membrane protein assembly factor BamB
MKLKELWRTRLSGEFMASPVLKDGLIYTVENKVRRLYVIEARTGEVVAGTRGVDEETKAERIESGVRVEGLAPAKYVYASPAASDRNVFFFDDAGSAAVLEPGREHRLARVNKIEDACVGTPFFVEDKIIIRGSQTVYCIGVKP